MSAELDVSVAFVIAPAMSPVGVRYCINLAAAAVEAGARVVVIGPPSAVPWCDEYALDLFVLEKSPLPLLGGGVVERMKGFLKKKKVRVLHGHGTAAVGLVRKLASDRMKCIVSIHEPETPSRIKVDESWFVTVANHGAREAVVNEAKVPKNRVVVLPECVDVDFPPRRTLPEDVRTACVGSFGDLVPEMGMQHFLRAARIVVDAGMEPQFLLAGTGPFEEELRHQVCQLGLAAHVTLAVNTPMFVEHVEAMDVAVVCPVAEGFTVRVVEAMARGCAVVATALGGVYELIDDGRTGLLVAPRDANAVAEYVMELLGDPEKARAMGEAARLRAKEMFSRRRIVECLKDLYGRLQ